MDPTHPADPTAEAFARHAAWLRRLARGLLYERADADDLVQAAWLAALRRGPIERESQGAWLAGAVRRLASQSARESARRARRERAAARPEAFRDPASALERLELTQLLVEAVRALDEPYRTTLLWRFFDGLSVRAIAKRRGVPLETARTHLKRGLELVRRRLDGRGPGARAELLAALVPLAGPGPGALGLAGPAVGKVLLETAGAVGMSTKLGLSVVGVVVAALALWAIRAASDDRAQDARADQGAVALDEAVRVEPLSPTVAGEPLAPPAPAPATSAASERALATDGAFVVRGRALLPADDTPIAGARVELRLYAGASSAAEPARSELVEADAEGRFRCAFAPPEGEATLWARVAMDGYHAWPVELRIPAGEGPPDDLDLRAYPLDCALTGRVLDPEGAPIAGVRLKGPVGEATSAADGTYELALSSLRSRIFVDALAKGWAQERQVVEPPKAGERVTADFHLRRELRVVGRVEDEFGGPIADAKLSSFFTHDNEATSAADGSFTLHSLDPGRAEHQVTARKEGYVRATETIETRGRDEVELVLRLPRGARVEGRVVDAEGEPLAGAELYIGFSPHAYDRLDALSAADGSFSFPAVGRGGQTLVTQLAGFASDHREIVVPEQGDLLGVEIVLGTGRFLAGRVVDEADEAVAEVRITATHQGEYIDVSAQSDAEGRFRLEHLPDEQVGIEVYGARIVRLEQAVAELDQDDLVLRVQRAARVAGTVVDGPTGAPLASFRIRFVAPVARDGEVQSFGYSASWMREGHLFTDSDGRWDSGDEQLPPGGVIGIEASAPGYAPTVAGRAVASVGADPAALVIELWPERIVRGRLVSAGSGEPVSGATLKRFTAQDPLSQYDNGDVHRRLMARTDAHGRFELRGVPAGEMSLAVEHPGHASEVDGPFEVPRERDPAERLIELDGGLPLRGRVLDCQGRALAGQIVELQGRGALAGMGLRVEAQTDAEGAFAFEHLTEGEYAVAQIAPTSWGARVRILERTVAVGQDTELELRADGDASLAGGIESDAELPGDFVVTAQRVPAESAGPDAPLALGAISSGARFELCGLPSGEYELIASRWDPGTGQNWLGQARARVAAGERAEVWIRVAALR